MFCGVAGWAGVAERSAVDVNDWQHVKSLEGSSVKCGMQPGTRKSRKRECAVFFFCSLLQARVLRPRDR